MSQRDWLSGSHGSEGTQMGSPQSGYFRTVLTLQCPTSHPVLIVFGNWINVSSPNPEITCCVFSVVANGVANLLINWQSFARIDRRQHTLSLITNYSEDGHVLFSGQSQSSILLRSVLTTYSTSRWFNTSTFDITQYLAAEQSIPL